MKLTKRNFVDAVVASAIDPVYAVENKGVGYLWDGNHRVAEAVALGKKTLPAWVGRRRRR